MSENDNLNTETRYQIISERRAAPLSIHSPDQIYNFLKKKYGKEQQEHFFVLTLSGSHAVIAIRIVTKGLLNRTLVHPREVFKHCIADNATAVVVAHNHPSGNTEPSNEDNKLTERLKDAGELIGIKLLDHVVFSDKNYHSYLEHGIL